MTTKNEKKESQPIWEGGKPYEEREGEEPQRSELKLRKDHPTKSRNRRRELSTRTGRGGTTKGQRWPRPERPQEQPNEITRPKGRTPSRRNWDSTELRRRWTRTTQGQSIRRTRSRDQGGRTSATQRDKGLGYKGRCEGPEQKNKFKETDAGET